MAGQRQPSPKERRKEVGGGGETPWKGKEEGGWWRRQRMVQNVHSLVTQKNQEWQEKLPAVVLKAEEILYSKAPSEAHYSDLSTLWVRANDAIDTIIRRGNDDADENNCDDTEAGGDLLLPCVEAALMLGCVPRRTSRSQRYNNPASYLSPPANDPIASQYSVLFTLADVDPGADCAASASCKDGMMLREEMDVEIGHLSGSGQTYPLYCFWKNGHGDPADLGHGCLGGGRLMMESSTNNVPNSTETSLIDVGCDLSLCLGMPLPAHLGMEGSCMDGVEDAGSSSSYNNSNRHSS